MKVRVAILVFCIIAFADLHSQDSKFKPEWSFGIGGGPTFASMSFVSGRGMPKVENTFSQKFHGGIAVRYITEKNLGFIIELNYAQQGWEEKFDKEEFGETADNLEYSRTFNNIELPFLTHIYFGNKTRFIFNLGPKISYIISESEKKNESFSNWLTTASGTNYMLDHYKTKAQNKFDYGLVGGMGMEFRTGIGNFAIEGRYYLGFGDVFKSGSGESFSRSANRVITAKLTYYIDPFKLINTKR